MGETIKKKHGQKPKRVKGDTMDQLVIHENEGAEEIALVREGKDFCGKESVL